MGQLADYPQHSPCTQVTAGNLAYVIYTSGSTGRPKGVAITHRNVQALVEWTAQVFSPQDLQGVLASTSVCFDLSVWELFVTLALGGQVILARNALELPQLPAREHVRLINSVPSAVAALARAGQIPDSVQIVNLAGEPLKQALVDTLYASGSIKHVNDLYGPSEDTTYSTWVRRSANGQASIGRPLSNSSGFVLDDLLQPVPGGLRGELYLGGAGVTRGYLLRPGLTAERFVPDPFGSAGGRLYRTGDLVRLGAQDNLEYLGRVDHQVKIRGLRIELGEIEAQLLALAGVREAVVLASNEQLVAYLVGDEQLAAADSVREQLRRVLPEYMVPAQVVRLEQLPLTPNGKLDRKALPTVANAPRKALYRAPQSSLEQQLAALWCDVLQLERAGLDDDFFELGGHSLQLVMMQTRVRGLLGIDVTLKQLQGLRTLGDLATYLQQMQSEQGQDLELELIFGALDELEEDNA